MLILEFMDPTSDEGALLELWLLFSFWAINWPMLPWFQLLWGKFSGIWKWRELSFLGMSFLGNYSTAISSMELRLLIFSSELSSSMSSMLLLVVFPGVGLLIMCDLLIFILLILI